MEHGLSVVGRSGPTETPLSSLEEVTVPVWFDDLSSGLSIRPHFVISGNLRDLYPLDEETGVTFLSFEQILWRIARAQDYGALFFYDPDGGLRLHDECDEFAVTALEGLGLQLGQNASTPAAFAELHRSITNPDGFRAVFVIDYASHLFGSDKRGLSEVLIEADRAARQTMISTALHRQAPTSLESDAVARRQAGRYSGVVCCWQ